jgi:cell division protein ZapD
VITYDYPLNEKVRTLLRLEDLYERVEFFATQTDAKDHHAALITLFEILEATGRIDLKTDLLQEIERQRAVLDGLRNNPGVAQETLAAVVRDMERAAAELVGVSGKFGQHLRDNEWLMGIKQRVAIPGGVCEFDLPSYYYWLNLPDEVRQSDLREWLAPVLPMYHGLKIVLQLLRASARPAMVVAQQGVYQQTSAGRVAQMLRIALAKNLPCIPEISANKYAFNIRFVTPDRTGRPRVYEQNVEFALTFCNL